MTIGQKIKKLRENKGLSQKALGELAGISDSIISAYEKDRKKPGRDTVIKLAAVLNVDVNYLVNDEVEALTQRDKKDIAKTLDKVMGDLSEGGALFYGNEMSDTDKELLKNALQNALEIIKIKNKEKYTPKKYK
ncbi:helix-turn-helix domain-containing protein [Cellulosilyticum sp. WCF-2]|uniref:helix-turn-helix domain-containing protein n=1 Tax=Cellulosilyticum sp. WCF-2 TaxID=2497860 RepID=UPI000F8D2AC9|nr:helix-turn-helix transcriptional regulator [Cellulosilyticum sp. WCF-2]QEH69759.1 helix-turn-helix transcriptional regulator [Cellulosilyticum sp. WCF-2]